MRRPLFIEFSSLECFLSIGSAAVVDRRSIVSQVLVQPIRHFAVQVIGCIVLLAGNSVILIRIVGAFKINIVLHK